MLFSSSILRARGLRGEAMSTVRKVVVALLFPVIAFLAMFLLMFLFLFSWAQRFLGETEQ
jgi:hypothetical protein